MSQLMAQPVNWTSGTIPGGGKRKPRWEPFLPSLDLRLLLAKVRS